VTSQLPERGKILIALGANCPGSWGMPGETIVRALQELERVGVRVESVSALYETAAVGRARQPAYINAVALLQSSLAAPALLRLVKDIERRAGRRGGRPWGARSLDIDLIDYKGMVRNWRGRRAGFARPGQRPLVLPHPFAHARPFVLRPLLDVAPNWRHPVLHRSARELWQQSRREGDGRVLRRL
jgi:2-amino-4-hydroxy-6-hydroxymethyldihydropteridine diphosphokinase